MISDIWSLFEANGKRLFICRDPAGNISCARLCGHINCRSKYDGEASAYECFGNEFTLDEGLRVKSKLRKV